MFNNVLMLLGFNTTVLVMVSAYAIWLLLNLWAYNKPRPGGYRGRGESYRPNQNSEEPGSGCIMFFILLSVIIYGVWLIYALFAAL